LSFLEVKEIHTFYGKSYVIQGISMNLEKGDLVCVLGRNGVGKTTMLHSIMGFVKPKAGSILFKGSELIGKEPFQIARMGIGLVPETRRIFSSLTVEENLMMGIKGREDRQNVTDNAWTLAKNYELFPKLKERKSQKGSKLSGGEQQILTIARTLMGNPEVLLVDEPTEGLAPLLAKTVVATLEDINKSGVTILLVEQNFKAAIKLARMFYLMGKGKMVFYGDGPSLLGAEDLRKQYLEV